MKQTGPAVVLITAANRDEADKIASVILEKRKAACVNIINGIASRYWWQGKIECADEILIIVKTKVSAVSQVIDLVKRNHSYNFPEIIALPIMTGNPDYLDWIDKEVRE